METLPNCPPIKITFLGTGTSSGVPMVACQCNVCLSTNPCDKRLRSSILIQSATTNVVVDTTPDFRYQMLRENITTLDAVVFTHPHKDHIGGLDDIRAFNYFSKKPMTLFANAITEKGIRNDFHYAFAPSDYEGLPKLEFVNIEKALFWVGDIPFLPIHLMHHNMPVLGFRIGKLAYITDANFIEEKELAKCNDIDVLIINMLRKEKHISHFTMQEAVDIGKGLKAKQIYGTHVSHQLGLHMDVNVSLPKNVRLANDGLVLNL
jgi:phosphoribosyl 1,2-cyclic phosphate phosphodiesterase